MGLRAMLPQARQCGCAPDSTERTGGHRDHVHGRSVYRATRGMAACAFGTRDESRACAA